MIALMIRDRKVGEVFQFEFYGRIMTLQCQRSGPSRTCDGCVLCHVDNCNDFKDELGECLRLLRKDGINVIFKQIK